MDNSSTINHTDTDRVNAQWWVHTHQPVLQWLRYLQRGCAQNGQHIMLPSQQLYMHAHSRSLHGFFWRGYGEYLSVNESNDVKITGQIYFSNSVLNLSNWDLFLYGGLLHLTLEQGNFLNYLFNVLLTCNDFWLITFCFYWLMKQLHCKLVNGDNDDDDVIETLMRRLQLQWVELLSSSAWSLDKAKPVVLND